MYLNKFKIGDIVTNNAGEVFEIKQVFSTGNVKVFVKECEEGGYLDVKGNDITPGNTYTLNNEHFSDWWQLVSSKDSNISSESISELEKKIHDAENTVRTLQNTISEQKSILENMKNVPKKKMEPWKMYSFIEGTITWNNLVLVSMNDFGDFYNLIFVDYDFDLLEFRENDLTNVEEITTEKAKKICKAFKEFSEM